MFTFLKQQTTLYYITYNIYNTISITLEDLHSQFINVLIIIYIKKHEYQKGQNIYLLILVRHITYILLSQIKKILGCPLIRFYKYMSITLDYMG